MKIEHLFPEITNLYGEHSNIRYLKDCMDASKMPCEVVRTGLNDRPLFLSERPDLIYMGAMTEDSQNLVLQTLLPFKDRLIELIQNDVIFLMTGNAMEIFGSSILDEDGSALTALNIFPTIAKRKMFDRFNSLYWGKFKTSEETLDIFGFKSQFAHSYVEDAADSGFDFKPLFDTVPEKVPGLNPETKGEGIFYRHFMGTYVIGPLLIVNPQFTLFLLEKMGVPKPVLAYEQEIMQAYQVRKDEFTASGKNFSY